MDPGPCPRPPEIVKRRAPSNGAALQRRKTARPRRAASLLGSGAFILHGPAVRSRRGFLQVQLPPFGDTSSRGGLIVTPHPHLIWARREPGGPSVHAGGVGERPEQTLLTPARERAGGKG